MRRVIKHVFSTALAMLTLIAIGFLPGNAQPSGIPLKPFDGHKGQFASSEHINADKPVTFSSQFHVGSDGNLNELQGIWLAGLSGSKNTPPTLLSLVWTEQNTSGWFPTWGLQLQSDAGLFPADVSPKPGSGFLSGSSFIDLGGVITPRPNHTFQVLLSYDPKTGRTDVGITDLTEGKNVVSKTLTLNPYDGPLHPTLGFIGDDQTIHVRQFDVKPRAIPVGTQWDLMMKDDGVYKRLNLARMTSQNNLALNIGPDDENFPGHFTLTADDGQTVHSIVRQSAASRTDTVTLPFDATDLPLGRITLNFNYVDEENVAWTLGQTPMHVVEANLRIFYEPMTINEKTLHGSIIIASHDETIDNVPVRLYATEVRPGQSRDTGKRHLVLEQNLQQITNEGTEFSFNIPITTNEKIFGLFFDVEFDKEVGIMMERNNEFYVIQ